jgi:Flp pilus assembly protein TadD
MSRSSGRVDARGGFAEKFERNEFVHANSGARYRVGQDGNGKSFAFELANGELRISGSRRLDYFIGSGRVGRSYAYVVDQFLYQAPVSYYSAASKWELSPGFGASDQLYFLRPIAPACLSCHASGVQAIAGTLNGYRNPPFTEGGIGCERCHGAGERHAASGRGSDIVNPASLAPDRRDSVCAQCHLSGAARIEKAGQGIRAYRPGALLSDFVSVFVRSGAAAETTVTSHFENLAQSRCKSISGARLWCGSCHEPHSTAGEASEYREKCLACHAAKSPCTAAAQVRARADDRCTECHMPKNPVSDVEHAVYTDHSIPRRGRRTPAGVATTRTLTLFGGGTASERDLGLAYASLVENGRDANYERRAIELLEAAVRRGADDGAVLAQLGNLYGYRGDADRAVGVYERAVRADARQVVAANNLGVHLMNQGRAAEAIRLWRDVLQRSPGFEAARMNLAVALVRAGDVAGAGSALAKGLELNPGAVEIRKLQAELLRRKVP